MVRRTLRVLEYEKVRVGEPLATVEGGQHALTSAEFEALVRFDEGRRERVFDIGHRSLRFRNFVGFVQVGRTGIEILPKVDRGRADGVLRTEWRDKLLHMLQVVGRFPIKPSSRSSLATDRGTLLDAFVSIFLNEVERITRGRMTKAYRTDEANLRVFTGRLVVREQIRHNLVHKERFVVERSVYDADHTLNHVLRAALEALGEAPLRSSMESRRRGLSLHFEFLPRKAVKPGELRRVALNRKTAHYALAIDLARLILQDLSPSLRAGSLDILAVLFDMNALWEAYVATLLRRAAPSDIDVQTQSGHLFWSAGRRQRHLRPDIVIRRRGDEHPLAVLDSKWKIPKGGLPSDGDLKQMFAYNEALCTPLAALIYPAEGHSNERAAGNFLAGRHRSVATYLNVERSFSRRGCEELLAGVLDAAAG